VRGHMRVDLLRDNRLAVQGATTTRATAQGPWGLRVNVGDINLWFGDLGLAFAGRRLPGISAQIHR
jgi:hypothetical protein